MCPSNKKSFWLVWFPHMNVSRGTWLPFGRLTYQTFISWYKLEQFWLISFLMNGRKNIFRTFPWRSTRSERPHWKCRLQATCCSNWLIVTSSHQNSSEIQMQIQIQMWPHRRWLGYMTRHQQGKVMFTVLFCSPASAFETRLSGMSVSERGCEIYLCCWAGAAAGRLRDFLEQQGCVSLCSKLSQSYCSNIAQYHYSKVPH